MSSTTERQHGQALAIFAISLATLLLAAALAFDGGMLMLERRSEQNAADAAALHGARYVNTDISAAVAAARAIATANGYTDGVGSQTVTVNIPPKSGFRQGTPGAVEVIIGNTRPSIFAGVMGIVDWPVGARAVAVDQDGVSASFALLALDPTDCDAILLAGTGQINAYGDVQVNSACLEGALRSTGTGTLWTDGGACNVVGSGPLSIEEGKVDTLQCVHSMDAESMPDPYLYLPDPPMPDLADPVVQLVGSELIPSGCPGSDKPATADDPVKCAFGGKTYEGTEWRIFPGLYPGGLDLKSGIFYLEPGIYWLGGGGLDAGGKKEAAIYSVDAGTTVKTAAGGVMFFNTELSPSGAGQWKPVSLGGGGSDVQLLPLADGSIWDGFMVFNDRNQPSNNPFGNTVTLNGGDSTMNVRGVIYSPLGQVTVNGSSSVMNIDQIIAYVFKANGSGGTINVLRNDDYTPALTAAGLVE